MKRSAHTPFNIPIDPNHPQGLAAQIAAHIIARIQDGTYPKNLKLPGSRTLADTLQVHRNTVLAAYEDLTAQGWLIARRGSGTFVHAEVPDHFRHNAHKSPPTTYTPPPPKLLEASSGLPDPRALPITELARSFRRTLRLHGKDLLHTIDPRGDYALRKALCTMLQSWRSIHATPEHILITRGSQMSLALAAQYALQPGDRVAVAHLGYKPAWAALRAAGASLVGIQLDKDGLCVEDIPQNIHATYITPHHQYPTTATLSAQRRIALVERVRQDGLIVIEDDYDFEFRFEGRPVMPLASMVSREEHIIYVGTLSKVLGSGLRIGYAVGPRDWVTHMAAQRAIWDGGGGGVHERVMAEWIEEGTLMRHIARMRRLYGTRRDALRTALDTFGRGLLRPVPASGGMAMWVEILGALRDPLAWSRAMAEHHAIRVHTHAAYSLAREETHRTFIRIGFASLNLDELRHAVSCIVSEVRTHQNTCI